MRKHDRLDQILNLNFLKWCALQDGKWAIWCQQSRQTACHISSSLKWSSLLRIYSSGSFPWQSLDLIWQLDAGVDSKSVIHINKELRYNCKMSRILWELVNLYMIINMYFIKAQIMHLSKSSLEFKNYFCPDTVLRDTVKAANDIWGNFLSPKWLLNEIIMFDS